MLSGPFVAGAGGCELMMLIASAFQDICVSYTESVKFLVRYAAEFITAFNGASADVGNNDLLFNDPTPIEEITSRSFAGLGI